MTETTKASIASDIASKINDNAAGEISAADNREVLTDIKDTFLGAQDAQEYTKQLNFNETVLSDGANISWDLNANQVAKVTLAGNRTLDNPTNQKAGSTYILRIIQDGTGSRTLSFGSAYDFPGGTAPVLTAAANAVDVLTFVSDGTNMLGVFQGDLK